MCVCVCVCVCVCWGERGSYCLLENLRNSWVSFFWGEWLVTILDQMKAFVDAIPLSCLRYGEEWGRERVCGQEETERK